MKKALSISLAATMAAALLTGCGGSAQSSSTAASGSTTTENNGRPAISFMIPTFYGTEFSNDGADTVIKTYEDYTNTTVNWRLEANDTYKDKFGMTLMDKDNMPMVLTASGAMDANIVDAAKKGAFWDLSEYLKDSEAYPNLSQANENVLNALTVDGQVVGIPRTRAIGRYGLAYRTDWAEAVGITEAPTTIEEVYDMWYKFTYNDPDGNGVDDTYGLELCKYTGPLDVMQTWFGCGNEWVEQDGKLVPVHQTAEYKEALDFMRKIYEEGLIRPDWATVDTSTWEDGCKKGEAGSFLDTMDGAKRIWNYFTNNNVASVTDPSTTATMTMVGPVNGHTLATSGYNGFYLITKSGAKTEEDLKNCLSFLDKMNDNEMLELADYGLEGVSYNLNENGNIVMNKELDASQTPNCGLNQAIAYIPNCSSTGLQLEKAQSQIESEACEKVNEQYAVFNPALGYLANSSVNAEVGTDIELIIEDARTQYICGQIDEAGLEAAAQQWLDRGGAQLVEELNTLYQADK